MTWPQEEPEHQQPWYCHRSIFQFQLQNSNQFSSINFSYYSAVPLSPYPRSPHFPCGENADGSIRTGTRRNLRILIWKKMRRQCGENADGSIQTGTRRNLRVLIWKKMRRKCGWEYSDRNTEKSLHYIRISAITRRIFPHSQFSASQP